MGALQRDVGPELHLQHHDALMATAPAAGDVEVIDLVEVERLQLAICIWGSLPQSAAPEEDTAELLMDMRTMLQVKACAASCAHPPGCKAV